MSLSIPVTTPIDALINSSLTPLTDFVMRPPLIHQYLQLLLMQVSFLPGTCRLFQLPISRDLENRCHHLRYLQDEPQLQIQSCLLFDLVLLRPLPLMSSALSLSLTFLLQLGKQSMLLFIQVRPTPLLLSKPLGVSSPITLIAPFTSRTAQARPSGPFTSQHMKMLLVPRLLLDSIQLLRLILFDPRVLLLVLTHGEYPLLILHLRVITFSLSKVVSRIFSSPFMLKVGASFYLLVSLVTLCARTTQAILNHAPIGEFRQCFFPVECTQCLCGHCQVKTH